MYVSGVEPVNILDRVRSKASANLTRKELSESRDLVGNVSRDSLLFYYGNNYSQRGQDGILQEIFRRLSIETGYFVELGGWDGVYLSNSRALFERGWTGVFIEGKSERVISCEKNYSDSGVKVINNFVGAPSFGCSGKRLVDLLSEFGIDLNKISFISIDVDGPDLEIFLDSGLNPPVVLLEGGTSFSPMLPSTICIPPEKAWRNLQQPFPFIFKSVNDAGYKIVCFHQDSYLVRNDLARLFAEYDAMQLYADSWHFWKSSERDNICKMRQRNPVIVETESKYFEYFDSNPLGYSKFP